MGECYKCKKYSLSFRRQYEAAESLEGHSDSPIWIVGLNPAPSEGGQDLRLIDELRDNFYKHAQAVSYFRDFAQVSPWLYEKLGMPAGVAHTDLVKCSSKSWPPNDCSGKAISGKAIKEIVENCTPYLLSQISKFRPKLIICNGAQISSFIRKEIPPKEALGSRTSYCSSMSGASIWIVLSGFIGRIDNYARRRLGAEIEQIATDIGLKTS